ncbi:signal peptidase I [Marinicauda algicola]|uniref:Signal peptidase I n=1 Tax=Marinicauda algicola TaxID=2029849 RepID=A0A4S2GX88_9PROT|nr:signal peptidase I [Marinicauda algicola]TGY87461.1 signal peptidase I [Marinicauda algicola]
MSSHEDPSAPDAMVAGDAAEFDTAWTRAPESVARVPERTPNRALQTARTLIWALLIALAVRSLLFQPFHIPTGSMKPTLLEGDYVIASKFAYGFAPASLPGNPPLGDWRVFGAAPARGDIVVFRAPQEPHQAYIKRVIGLPGDRVAMMGGVILLNDVEVPRGDRAERAGETAMGRHVAYESWREILPEGIAYTVLDRGDSALDHVAEFTVPEGHYFVLGDNRDESRDSRVAQPEGPGLVPASHLIGRAEIVLLSVDEQFQLFAPWTWWRVRPARFALGLDGSAA